LIAIMGDRLSAHIKTLQAVNWEAPKPAGTEVNEYMEVLVKETTTLHKVLSRYLSPAIVEDVMAQVFAAINHRLSEEYGKIALPHREAKLRLLADAKYLHQKLSGLKNVGAPSGMLETVIAELSISRTPTSATGPRPAAAPIPVRMNSANQRLKGLLSGTGSSDRALPATPSMDPLASSSPQTAPSNSINGGTVNGTTNSSSSSPPLPAPPPPAQQGFRQVNESRADPDPEQLAPVPLLSQSESSSADLIASADSGPLPSPPSLSENSNPPRTTHDDGGVIDGNARSVGGQKDSELSAASIAKRTAIDGTTTTSRNDDTEDHYVHF